MLLVQEQFDSRIVVLSMPFITADSCWREMVCTFCAAISNAFTIAWLLTASVATVVFSYSAANIKAVLLLMSAALGSAPALNQRLLPRHHLSHRLAASVRLFRRRVYLERSPLLPGTTMDANNKNEHAN